MTRVQHQSDDNYQKPCACGCGELITKIDTRKRPHRFKHGHNSRGEFNPMYGKIRNDFANNQRGENNPYWKGDKVGYAGVHKWIKQIFPKPDKCQECGNKAELDLANITGVYNRELQNWNYLCRSCHIKQDGRINNLKQFRSIE